MPGTASKRHSLESRKSGKPEQMPTATIAIHMLARGVNSMRRYSAGMLTKLSSSSRVRSITSVACMNSEMSSRKEMSCFPTRPNSRCSSSGSGSESSESVELSPFQVSGEEEDTMMKEFFELAKKNDDAGVEELVESQKFLLIHEAINTTDAFGNSPIMIAAQRNWSEVIIHLQFNQYCDVNHQNFFGSSALMCSASHGHLDALRILCNNPKTEINLLSRFGQTALMKAAQAGKLDSIKILLDHGADLEVRNKQGKGAVEIAEEKGHPHIAEYLLGIRTAQEAAVQPAKMVKELEQTDLSAARKS